MDRFTELETFIAVADAQGFNAAARSLNRSPPSITRIIGGLEARIGTRLFVRTTRKIALTEAGARLLEDARRILDDLASAEASAAGAHEEPQGVLAVTAPVTFGRIYIAPLLQSFLDAHPKVTARALYVDRVVNLIDEGLDVAVRIGELPDSTLTAVRVGEVRQVVVATPGFFEAHGIPDSPLALSYFRIAMPAGQSPRRDWEFSASGEKVTVPVDAVLQGNTVDSAIDAAMSGWALTRALSYQVADALKSGELIEVLAEFEDRTMPVHLLHAEGSLRAAKIRAFLDHATQSLRGLSKFWVD